MIGLITMLKMYQVVKVLTWPLHPWTIGYGYFLFFPERPAENSPPVFSVIYVL